MAGFQHELIRLIRGFHLDYRDPIWKERLFMAEQGMYSEEFCQTLIYEARLAAEGHIDQGNLLYRTPDEDEFYAQGKPDIELGSLIEGEEKLRFGIRYRDRPRNVLILGGAGAGKTVTCRSIFLNVDKLNQHDPENPTLLFIIDVKTDNRDLENRLQGNCLYLSPYHNLKIGLNGPTDVPPNVWINTLSMSLADRLGLIVSRSCLTSLIKVLLVAQNPGLNEEELEQPGSSKSLIWPSLKMVLEAIKRQDVLDCVSSKASYGETLIQTLTGFLQDSGTIFDCSNGLDIQRDVIAKKRHCILDVPNLPPPVLGFVVDFCINQVLVSRLQNNYKCDRTEIIYGIDEGDILMETESQGDFSTRLSPWSRLCRLGREAALMSVVAISGPQSAGEHIHRNTVYTIAHNLADSHSVAVAQHMLKLRPACQRMLSSLLPGQCIFQQNQASWNHAVWCQVDYVAPSRKTGPIEYEQLPFTPAVELSRAHHVISALNDMVAEDKKAHRRIGSRSKAGLSQKVRMLLTLAVSHPYMPVARLFDRIDGLGFSGQKAVRKEIQDNKYAEFAEVRIGKTTMLLIEPKDTAYHLLGQEPPTGENRGRGKLVHRSLAHWIKQYLAKQGRQAFLEWVVPGTNHPVDVAVEADELWDAYEVCVTASGNLTSHITACFEASQVVRKLFVVTTQAQIAKQLRQQVLAEVGLKPYISNIVFESIQNYIPKEI